ncbi:unnamed protein product [Thelazia callipaeda]|uniref:Protein-L-isoaspartate(D-aspartate) O-methyltransferase n=1 Tax=Thelazia callipaeda TaxID=103827 RepID=A0A0N5D6A8_THECL|nr:unnamed protein product [Thelazia callipaeda]
MSSSYLYLFIVLFCSNFSLLLLILSSDCDSLSDNNYCNIKQNIVANDQEEKVAEKEKKIESIYLPQTIIQEEEEGKQNRELHITDEEKQVKTSSMKVLRETTRLLVRSTRNAMAWRSGGDSNLQLVNNLQANGLFRDERVRNAMLQIDRGDFTSTTPYGDHPVSIGYGATISAPHMHASALELLKDHLKEGNRALDVGSGSGYLTACMAIMVGKEGKVVGIEHIQGLLTDSKKNIMKNHENLLSTGRIILVKGDGRQGYKDEAPYDAIHVGAAASEVPTQLIEQLAKGGRMVIPVGLQHSTQRFMQIDKDENGVVTQKDLMGVVYVPLTDEQSQLRN